MNFDIERLVQNAYAEGANLSNGALKSGIERAWENSEAKAALTELLALRALSAPEPVDAYDAGLLNDHGGGDVGWWQDYIRAELGRAHDHYAAQVAALSPSNPPRGDVKALEWRQSLPTLQHAFTGFGSFYGVEPANGGWVLARHEGSSTTKSFWDTEEAAKAAAQAHFDAAILSALKPVEPAGISEEMVERGLAYYDEGGCIGLSEYERREVVTAILEAALNGAVS